MGFDLALKHSRRLSVVPIMYCLKPEEATGGSVDRSVDSMLGKTHDGQAGDASCEDRVLVLETSVEMLERRLMDTGC